MTKVLIIEDEPLIARDLKRIVEKNGYVVSGLCYNSDRALDVLAKEDYHIVLLDIQLKGSRDGIELAEIINSKYQVPFVYITSFADKETIERVKETNPGGYIVKPFNSKDIYSSIELAIHQREQTTPKELNLAMINARIQKALTQREFEIIAQIIQGHTNQYMAELFFVSENTIRSHIKNIYLKLNTHSRAETATKVFELMK